DHGAIELYLDALSPEMVLQTGSSLAAALRQGTNLLAGREGENVGGVLVLISDGEALEEQEAVLAAARRAAAAGVTVYTLGIGTAQGAPVPDLDSDSGEPLGFKTDPATGELAVTRLDESLLREIARLTGGAYHRLGEAGALDRLLARLEQEERGRSAEATRRERAPRYGWFVGLALLCLSADALRERWRDERRV
ncbi:MAG TPA: vWA domain-containing protein, partial [Longimicrobiaceae bacterium]|nr:vWA domain-containing protein [Longimicrobiaceae bacterium]